MRDCKGLGAYLFNFKKRYWYKNLRDIKIFLGRIPFLLKHGYCPVANWETSAWFIDVMKEILTNYRHYRMGTPVIIDDYFQDEAANCKRNEQEYNKILDRMIELLNLMDETNPIYNDMDWQEVDKKHNAAKDEFFELFSKHFYGLWD